jgi:hypothetical protein
LRVNRKRWRWVGIRDAVEWIAVFRCQFRGDVEQFAVCDA